MARLAPPRAIKAQTTGNGCAAIDGDCRYLFTNNGSTKVMLAADNLNDFKGVFGTFTDPEATVLMERIHAGNDTGGGVYVPALGGIDRSTVAVIEPSSVIGTPRATVAYVGGLDGMLHAICADSTVAPCIGKAGRELWAFMPRSQLPNVATNQTRLDGSPKVADVFADFGSGTKGYRTVLTFQAGTNDAPVTYALDITDPTAPAILWEHTAPGGGIGAAMGVINIPTEGLVSVTFIQSSIGSPAGMYLAAVRTHDGSVVWSSTQQYPAARGQVNGSAAAVSDVPATGIPGGVTIFASVDGDSLIDTLLAPTLWGSVWALNPVDGESLIGTAVCTGTPVWQDTAGCTPLFKFVDDYHPIGASVSVYREQTTQSLRGLVVTGGFTDNDQPDSSIWAPSTINQYAVSFAVDVATTDTAIQAAADPSVGLYIDLGAGNRAYSQGVVLGNEVFITTDSAGVFGTGTNTGQLIQANLGTGVAAAPTVIANGVAAVDVSAGSNAVYTGSGGDVLKTDITGYDANGSPIENGPDPTSRLLWLLK